jgi:hypothetical protein
MLPGPQCCKLDEVLRLRGIEGRYKIALIGHGSTFLKLPIFQIFSFAHQYILSICNIIFDGSCP